MDFDDGIPGLLYTVEFIESYFGPTKSKFKRERVLAYAECLLEHGYKNRFENGTL